MSVLIKGIDMPRSCAECRFLEGEAMDGLCHASEKWLDDDDYFLWFQYPEGDIEDSKPANCPLIEIPPHGRLIDADKLLHDGDNDKGCIDEWINSPGLPDGVKIGIGAVRNLVCYAPTVIEAEE